ncbi:MAG TPA: hypothetical protein VIR61_00755 [Sulfuricaulis sp.]
MQSIADELSPEEEKGIQDAIFAGKIIEAINLYRTAAGMDLKDSKAAVEELTEAQGAGSCDVRQAAVTK